MPCKHAGPKHSCTQYPRLPFWIDHRLHCQRTIDLLRECLQIDTRVPIQPLSNAPSAPPISAPLSRTLQLNEGHPNDIVATGSQCLEHANFTCATKRE